MSKRTIVKAKDLKPGMKMFTAEYGLMTVKSTEEKKKSSSRVDIIVHYEAAHYWSCFVSGQDIVIES